MADIRTSNADYPDDGQTFEGFVAWDAAAGRKSPAVMIASDWTGLLEPTRNRAEQMAARGYVGFGLDVYGKGKRGQQGADNSALINPLLADRARLRRRLLAGVAACAAHPAVDAQRLAVIGFCFGGLCALDLARANAPGLIGAVSFHGIYAPPGLGQQEPIRAKVLVCHGWDDPFTPVPATVGLAAELTEARADWQLHAYGRTVHAFTTAGANNPAMGAVYDANADRRSFAALEYFLDEIFRA
ncbi:MAG TPA: dienelactone hydrolase family protein [Candidatus Binatia bacterium]|jgi:dienelactone hydrolase